MTRAVVRRSVLAVLLALAAGGTASADLVALKDGRFVEGRPVEKVEGGVKITYENGDVVIPDALVLDWYQGAAQGDFVPRTDEEREKASKGLAPWKGGWIPKEKRAKLMQEEAVKRAKRAQQTVERREWRNHATVETKVFVFMHTLPDELFQRYQDLFETYYSVFMKEWKITPAPRAKKPTINIYQSEGYFNEVSGAPRGVAGYYSPTDKDLHFYYDRERESLTIDVMFHEGNHMLTHFIDEHIWYPAWINEGLAEYYGASEWNPETKTMKTGGIQSARLVVLWDQVEGNDGKLLGLQDLIETPRLDAIKYSWAWSLCHFLMSTEKYREGFRKYYVGLAKDKKIPKKPFAFGFLGIEPKDQIEALLRYLKVKDLKTLETEWHEYLKTTLSLNRSDIDYAAAGWIMTLYGQSAKARKFFRKAIEGGAKSPYVYGAYADLLEARGRKESAIENAKKALELDPLHARAIHLLGRVAYEEGDVSGGEKTMKLAMEIDPDDRELWYRTALLKEGKKRREEAGGDGGGD